MIDYGRNLQNPYGNDFSAAPKTITSKNKYKDPYGQAQQEYFFFSFSLSFSLYSILLFILLIFIFSDYFPQNIMYDKRVARGSTYAAMVIPAGSN
jgi:hypothetical protein